MTLLKHICLPLAALMATAFMTTAVFASNVGTVTRDSINVRAADSTNSAILGVTNTGDSYAILAVEPGWVKVQYPSSGEAYIASLYVKVSEADAKVIDHAVNVRSGPSTSTEVIGQVNVGDKVSVIGKSADGYWYKVNYNGRTAYISSDYLGGSYLYLVQADAPAAETPETTVETTTQSHESQAAEEIINEVIEEVAKSVEAVTEETTEAEPQPSAEEVLKTFAAADPDTYAIINSPGGLRLRSMPSTASDSTIISVLNDGYAVSVIETGEGWLYIADDYQNEGYISSDYVEIKHGEKPENSGHVDFNKESLTGSAAEIAEFALNYVGTPYVYGGTDLNSGVDCSGFVYSVYKNFGITLQRNSASMYSQGTYVDKSNLQAGDLLFFNTGGNTNISHVGMYLGDNMYIHSSTYSTGVIVEDLYDDYSTRTYVGAKRIIN